MDVISGSTPSRPPTGYRALVVDDEAALADVVASYLRRDHMEVTVCHSGAEALNAARGVDPDVVVLDLGLPGIDGLEVCRQLRTFSDAYVYFNINEAVIEDVIANDLDPLSVAVNALLDLS